MNTKKNFLFLILGLLMTFLLPNYATATVSKNNVPASSLDSKGKVSICHSTGSSTNPFVEITISVNGLNGHDGHAKDEFLNISTNKCGSTGKSPLSCSGGSPVSDESGSCIRANQCSSPKVLDASKTICFTPPTCSATQTLNADKDGCDDVATPTPTPTPTNSCSKSITVPGSSGSLAFSALDTQGTMLCFDNPEKVSGTGTVLDAKKDDVYKYTNVITVNGVQVNAVVTITDMVNLSKLVFDDAAPNPTGSSRADGHNYTTSFGAVVPEGAIFAPQEWTADNTKEAYAKFTIAFQDTTGKPVVLKNVYNNSLDDESTEYNAYGGFSSYTVSPDNKTNTAQHIIATTLGNNIRFSSSDCTGDKGLFIKDQSRVQAKFDTITSLSLTLGQFANGNVPNGSGGYSSCTNSSQRYYGAVFVQDQFIDTPGTPIEITAPTVDLLTTSDTTPTVTGTIGGIVSATANGSAVGTLGTTDTFTVKIDGTSYTPTITGITWKVDVTTVLSIGSHEIEAKRNGVLIDQSSNELVIITACTGTKVWDSATSACLEPSSNSGKVALCHSGNGKNYAKILIAASGMNGHETHEFDEPVDANGLCPGDIPVAPTCTQYQILDAVTNQCVDMWNGLPVSEILALNAKWGAENYLGASCQKTNNVYKNTGSVDTEWASCSRPGGVFKSHIQTNNTINYHCLFEVTGTGISGSNGHIEKQFDVPANYTVQQKWDLINSQCGVIATPPTVSNANTTEGTATIINGGTGASNTISSVTLTKIKDGLNVAVSGAAPTTIGSNITAVNNAWSVSSGTSVAVGTYTITVTDGNSKTASATLTVTCPTTGNTVATAAACIAPVAPTVTSTNSTDLIAVPISGGATTSSTISSVTLTKIKDGLGATVTGATPSTIGTNLAVTNNAWTVTSGAVAVGTYTITAKDGNNLSGTGTLTVTCLTGKVATATACTTIVVPTISCATTTDHVAGICKGNVGTSTALTITIAGTNVSNASITPVVANGTWTYTAPILAAGSYNVTVTGTNGVAPQTGTLVVTASLPPVVTKPADTTESVPVDIHGTFGTSTTMSSVVLTKVGSTPAVTITLGAVILDAPTNNWKVSSGALTVGSYTIVATDSNLLSSVPVTLTVTCADSKTANFAGDSCISAPTVTASQIFSTTTPVITGTVGSTGATGDPVLGTTEAFKVVVNGVTYTYRTDAALTVTGTAWALTIPTTAPLTAGQSYPVVATRDGTLSSPSVNITINGAPSVTAHPDTYDTTPILTGTVGTTALGSDTFSVKINNQTYPYAAGVTTDGNVIVNSDLTWRLTIPVASKLPAATYTVEAIRNTLIGTGSIVIKLCALPSIVNEVTDTCSLPVPTVAQARWDSNTTAARTITGTVGDVALGTDELFTVTISGGIAAPQTYNRSSLSFTGLNWTLTIPTSTTLGAGTYSVEAARNTTAKNTDAAGKLVITLVCDRGFTDQGGECISDALRPTVNSQPSTSDTTPVITGTVGNSALGGNDTFAVTVGAATYTNGDGNLVVTGTTWTLTIPFSNALTVGTFTITATRNTTSGTGSITITECTKILDSAGHCVDGSRVPTITGLPLPTKNKSDTITVNGTVGDVALSAQEMAAQAFTVSVTEHGNPTNILSVSNPVIDSVDPTKWTITIPPQSKTGTFDVNAVRNTDADTTNSELQIGIQVCQLSGSLDKTIAATDWNDSQYVLGKCSDATDPMPKPPYPDDPERDPSSTDENCTAAEGGGKRSLVDVEQATVKRARIVNATTIGGTIETYETLSDTVILYGEKVSGTMDISHADITNNVATNVNMTGVTLNNVYVGITGSFNINTGEFSPADSSIDVSGGITNRSGTITTASGATRRSGIVIGGVITSGASAAGEPIRGSVIDGSYNVETSTTNLTKGRRVIGTLTGATITGATTTTARINGSLKTVVSGGTIAPGASLTVESVFGTVVNAKIVGATLTDANHCFSSGTVGSRGQLNWKEVVQ